MVFGKMPRASACSECVFGAAIAAGDSGVAAACERAAVHRLRPREPLFREGERAASIFIIRSGQFKLTSVDSSGREHVLGVFGPGELLGLDSLDDGVSSVSAVALRSAEVCAIATPDVVEALRVSPTLGRYTTRRLVGQLREARALQVCLGTVRSTAKVAAWLSRHVRACEDGLLCVPRNMTLADLAGVVGLAQETACRALGELEREGCIRGEPKRWVIVNRDGLRRAGKMRTPQPKR